MGCQLATIVVGNILSLGRDKIQICLSGETGFLLMDIACIGCQTQTANILSHKQFILQMIEVLILKAKHYHRQPVENTLTSGSVTTSSNGASLTSSRTGIIITGSNNLLSSITTTSSTCQSISTSINHSSSQSLMISLLSLNTNNSAALAQAFPP